MNDMIGSIAFLEIIYVIWGILCIILFFKVWSACNCIKRIADKYAPIKKEKFETREDIEKWLHNNQE